MLGWNADQKTWLVKCNTQHWVWRSTLCISFADVLRCLGLGMCISPINMRRVHKQSTSYEDPHAMFDMSSSYSNQAMAPFSELPCHSSHPNFGYEDAIEHQIAPAPALVSSPDHGTPTAPASMNHNASLAGATNTRFVPYSAKAYHQKRPRGTTGNHFCDECDCKFTTDSSLVRHQKTSHGISRSKRSFSTLREIIKAKDFSEMPDSKLPAIETGPTLFKDQSQNMDLNASGDALSTTSTVVNTPNIKEPAETGSVVLDSNLLNLFLNKPMSATRPYVPLGLDTSTDYRTYFCDLCPGMYTRRDIMQLHKSRDHGVTEMPYLPSSGTIDRPPYLIGVTLENANPHSQRALKTFEDGGLSTSPCQPCTLKGLDCIVNPFFSPRCSYCNHVDKGRTCGAAGVKYA